MSDSPRPMPSWLKWFCRILGLLSILGVIAGLVYFVPAAWLLVRSLRSGGHVPTQTLGMMIGELVGIILLGWLGVWLLRRPGKRKKVAIEPTPTSAAVLAHQPAHLAPAKRWSSCNVLQTVGDSRHIWQFDGSKFTLDREQTLAGGQPLPTKLIGKSWRSLWQPQLNIACLPGDSVFLRPVQLPKADLAEIRSMVELQLEKISPLPVTQIVWGIHALSSHPTPLQPGTGDPSKAESLQTVIVVIVSRSLVEEFLGRLERDGFLADRLEVPMLDQLQHTAAGEGVWIYLKDAQPDNALAAWWQDGVLHNLSLINLPADKNQTDMLREQLVQMAWAGEIEGWFTKSTEWHLVTDSAAATEWQAAFGQALGEPVKIATPLQLTELVAATARRTATANNAANLVPMEYTTRYRQQFVDHLWLRGLTSVGLLYAAGVIIYFIALGFLGFQVRAAEKYREDLRGRYNNAIQLKARYQIMKERQDLKFAALDCWKITSELLPKGAALESLDFKDGAKLTLRGTASADLKVELNDFNAAMRKASANGQPLFSRVEGLTYNSGPNNNIAWSFSCELNRREEKP